MLVKDSVNGLTWVEPVNITQLNNAVGAAETAKTDAKNYAQTAGNSAARAEREAGNAERARQQTMVWVNEKFWWGSLEEYNQHIQENGLNPGTFYFVTPEK
jgi:hypothetical protein